MTAKDAIKTFASGLIRHFDHLHTLGVLSNGAYETFIRAVQLQAKNEIERIEVIPKDASPLAAELLSELRDL